MSRRVVRDIDFMEYVMTPPARESFYRNDPDVGDVVIRDRNVSRYEGLGQIQSSGVDYSTWIMPVVIIVVSAMALMTVYAVVMNKR